MVEDENEISSEDINSGEDLEEDDDLSLNESQNNQNRGLPQNMFGQGWGNINLFSH